MTNIQPKINWWDGCSLHQGLLALVKSNMHQLSHHFWGSIGSFFSFLSYAKILHSFFYPSYVSICENLQKTIALSSGSFMLIDTFTIQCICKMMNRKQSLRDHLIIKCPKNTQQIDRKITHADAWFNQTAPTHLYSNHTSACVPPPLVDSPNIP